MKKMKPTQKKLITTFGPYVVDIHVSADSPLSRGNKQDGNIWLKSGGGAVNTARAARRFVDVTPILLTGQDQMQHLVKHLAQEEFNGSARILPNLTSTRCSVISGNSIVTKRSSTRTQTLPENIRNICAPNSMLIVAPMTQTDYPLVMELLKSNPNSILQLSRNQLENSGMSIKLAQAAHLTVINEPEAALWTGTSDPIRAIQWIRTHGVKNVMITSKYAVDVYCDSNSFQIPAIQINRVKSTVGAGDVFTGTLAAMRVSGASWKNAIKLAITAAGMHVEQTEVKGMTHLQAETLKRKTVPFKQPKSIPRRFTLTKGAALMATSLLLATAIGLMF